MLKYINGTSRPNGTVLNIPGTGPRTVNSLWKNGQRLIRNESTLTLNLLFASCHYLQGYPDNMSMTAGGTIPTATANSNDVWAYPAQCYITASLYRDWSTLIGAREGRYNGQSAALVWTDTKAPPPQLSWNGGNPDTPGQWQDFIPGTGTHNVWNRSFTDMDDFDVGQAGTITGTVTDNNPVSYIFGPLCWFQSYYDESNIQRYNPVGWFSGAEAEQTNKIFHVRSGGLGNQDIWPRGGLGFNTGTRGNVRLYPSLTNTNSNFLLMLGLAFQLNKTNSAAIPLTLRLYYNNNDYFEETITLTNAMTGQSSYFVTIPWVDRIRNTQGQNKSTDWTMQLSVPSNYSINVSNMYQNSVNYPSQGYDYGYMRPNAYTLQFLRIARGVTFNVPTLTVS
jgi:hypothetical protein